MKKTFKYLAAAGAGGAGAVIPMVALASSHIPTGVDPIVGGSNLTVAGVIKAVITFILAFAAAIAVLFLVVGGILYMTAGGNDDKVKKARSMIFSAIIGLIVIILSFIIVNFATKSVKDVCENTNQEGCAGGTTDTKSN